jgi:hypothetical protein
MVWLIAGAGIALFIVSFVFRYQVRLELKPPVDEMGHTARRVRIARRASLAGVLPDDPELRALTLDFASNAVTNIPLRGRYLPLQMAGLGFLLAACWTLVPQLPAAGILAGFLAGAASSIYFTSRAARNGQKLLDQQKVDDENASR